MIEFPHAFRLKKDGVVSGARLAEHSTKGGHMDVTFVATRSLAARVVML